ncbi:MAG: amidohydrolase family protein [Microcoleaceae cyanobacterium]
MNFLQRFFRQFMLGVVIVIAIALFTKIAVAQVQATSSILFENVQIFNGTADKLSTASNVLVVDNKIKTIAQVPITSGLTANTTKINGNGRVLMPGLIDNHVHIIMTASTLSDLLNPNTTEAELQARAKKEAEEMLLRGFTTVRDLGGPVFQLKANIDQGKTPGPRIYPSGAMISQTSGHGDFRSLTERPRRFGGKLSRAEEMGAATIADGRDEILTATRENLRFGATQIKLMAGGGVSSIYDPIDVAQYTLDELKAAVEAADDWGTYVAVHAYTPKAVQRAIEAGVKCIEHGQLLDEKTMQILANKGIWLSAQAFEETNNPNFTSDQKAKQKQVVEGVTNAFAWAKKYNVKLAWGTDFLFNPANNKNQNAYIVKLEEWMNPFEALKLVTHDNAELLTLSGPRNPYPGRLGVIAEGAYADMILVEGNPLENLSVLVDYDNNFKVIVKDGKIYKNSPTS